MNIGEPTATIISRRDMLRYRVRELSGKHAMISTKLIEIIADNAWDTINEHELRAMEESADITYRLRLPDLKGKA